jgi:hypothetical protein
MTHRPAEKFEKALRPGKRVRRYLRRRGDWLVWMIRSDASLPRRWWMEGSDPEERRERDHLDPQPHIRSSHFVSSLRPYDGCICKVCADQGCSYCEDERRVSP